MQTGKCTTLAVISIALSIWISAILTPRDGFEQLPRLEPQIFGRPLSPSVPVMVLLSGFPDSHDMWTNQIDEFGKTHHIVSLSTPDFDGGKLRRAWGYDFHETTRMLKQAIDDTVGLERQIDLLVAHDWGALWAYYFIGGVHQGRVAKFVAADIGASPLDDPGATPLHFGMGMHAYIYQYTLGTVFAIGSSISPAVAQSLLDMAWSLMPSVGPMHPAFDWSTEAPRPREEVKWWMGYPYYYLRLSHLVAGGQGRRPPAAPFPRGVPTLFIFGARKRTMYHTEGFVTRLQATPGCRVVEYADCAHWMMHEAPGRFSADIRAFLEN